MTREIGEWVAAMENLAHKLGGNLIDVDYAIMESFPGYRLYRIEREAGTWLILSTRYEHAIKFVESEESAQADMNRDYPE